MMVVWVVVGVALLARVATSKEHLADDVALDSEVFLPLQRQLYYHRLYICQHFYFAANCGEIYPCLWYLLELVGQFPHWWYFQHLRARPLEQCTVSAGCLDVYCPLNQKHSRLLFRRESHHGWTLCRHGSSPLCLVVAVSRFFWCPAGRCVDLHNLDF